MADHALFKMVRYVLPQSLRPELNAQPSSAYYSDSIKGVNEYKKGQFEPARVRKLNEKQFNTYSNSNNYDHMITGSSCGFRYQKLVPKVSQIY
jgi:hypothetical protein